MPVAAEAEWRGRGQHISFLFFSFMFFFWFLFAWECKGPLLTQSLTAVVGGPIGEVFEDTERETFSRGGV